MSTIANEQTKLQKNAFVVYMVLAISQLMLIILSAIFRAITKKQYHDELTTLNHQYYYSFTFFMNLATYLFFFAMVIYFSFLSSKIESIKNVDIDKLDFGNALEEIFRPTSPKFKRRKILLVIVLVLAFLVMICSQIYIQIGIVFML